MNRSDHLQWCKDRANQYLDVGNIQEGVASMLSDLSKHVETEAVGCTLAPMGMMAMMSGNLDEAKRFVNGFN